MSIVKQIQAFITSVPEPKQTELALLHSVILELSPKAKLWFLDGKNEQEKVVSNPSIGYGQQTIHYADGSSKPFYQVGISTNSTGISVYIMGLADKNYLPNTYSNKIGKATVTGYCIKFKSLKDINLTVLKDAIQYGFEHTK